jgi:hypothetical protein
MNSRFRGGGSRILVDYDPVQHQLFRGVILRGQPRWPHRNGISWQRRQRGADRITEESLPTTGKGNKQ